MRRGGVWSGGLHRPGVSACPSAEDVERPRVPPAVRGTWHRVVDAMGIAVHQRIRRPTPASSVVDSPGQARSAPVLTPLCAPGRGSGVEQRTMSGRVAVVYYSATGNVHALAEALAEVAVSSGAEVRLRRVTDARPASGDRLRAGVASASGGRRDQTVDIGGGRWDRRPLGPARSRSSRVRPMVRNCVSISVLAACRATARKVPTLRSRSSRTCP